jgi:hypothetical protein
MVNALWLIPAIIIGALIGVVVMCLMQINGGEDDD